MNFNKTNMGYEAPKAELIFIQTEAILCGSFSATVEDMNEVNYTFTY